MSTKRPKRLKPTGHSAVIESLIQPAIVIGSTLMSAIAAYVLALDEITRLLNRHGTPSDVFIVALCAGMGFLIDMAIIVSATRYKMHAVRGDPREERWLTLAKWVLGVGLASETLTLFYFFVHLSAQAFPDPLVQLADAIHSVLAILRAFLPPIILAYFAAGVLPVMFDRADRNREIKSRTSSNIMLLIDRLSEVLDTDDKAEMLRALGGQLMLDTYATYDEVARTSEEHQLGRDAKLLTHLARIHRLNWSAIAVHVAPELAERASTNPLPVTQVMPSGWPASSAPDDDRTPPPTNGGTRASYDLPDEAPEQMATPLVAASYDPNPGTSRSNGRRPRGKTRSVAASRARVRVVGEGMDARRERQRKRAFDILDKEPDINPTMLSKRIRSTWKTANRLKIDWQSLQAQRQATQQAVQ